MQASTLSVLIKKKLNPFHSKLHILNVDSEHYIALTEEYQAEKALLKEMFSEFETEFYFLDLHEWMMLSTNLRRIKMLTLFL